LDWRDNDQAWDDDPRTHGPMATSADITGDKVTSRKRALV